MMAHRLRKLAVRITIGDQSGDVIAPTQVSLKQIIRSHLEVATRSIDAAEHYLIIQDQLADQFRALNLQRMIAAGNACDHINPVQALEHRAN